jgi:hypothetical protein
MTAAKHHNEESGVEDATARLLSEHLTRVENLLAGRGDDGLPAYREIVMEVQRHKRVIEGEGPLNPGVLGTLTKIEIKQRAMGDTLDKIEGHLRSPPKKENGKTDWRQMLLSPQTFQMGAALIVIVLFVAAVLGLLFGLDVVGLVDAANGS